MTITVAGLVEPASRTTTVNPWDWSHDQGTSSPQGVLVGLVHGTSSTDHVTGVTYGGVALTRVQRNVDTSGEAGAAEWWFRGDSLPTGTQTVSVALATGTTDDFTGISLTLDAAANVQVIAVGGVSGDAANPSAALLYGGVSGMAFAAVYSGLSTNAEVTANETTITKIGTVDLAGTITSAFLRQVTAGTSDFTIAAISSTDDIAFAAVAIGEVTVVAVIEDMTLTDGPTVQRVTWDAAVDMNLLMFPALVDTIFLTDVPTVGNDRHVIVSWVELEVPASPIEVTVPFARIQSEGIMVRLLYIGDTEEVLAINATNTTGVEGTFVIDDNGVEQIVIIPVDIMDEDIPLDIPVVITAGVSCHVRVG